MLTFSMTPSVILVPFHASPGEHNGYDASDRFTRLYLDMSPTTLVVVITRTIEQLILNVVSDVCLSSLTSGHRSHESSTKRPHLRVISTG
jgi:hypothetical protein